MPARPTRTVIAPPPAAPVQTGTDGNPVVPPPVVPDVITRLDPARNTESNSGSTTFIDVHPDFRFPLMSWIYSLCHSIPSSAFSTHPLASPASVLCYTQIMFIGLLFYNDAFLRPVPSAFASAILNDSRLRLIFDMLIDMVVPSFALAEFEAFRVHMDDLADNLIYFGTLAGSSFYHDFGRFPPATLFAQLHNLLSQLGTSTNYGTLAANIYSATVAQVTIPGTNGDINLTPSHFFGTFTSSTSGRTTTHTRFENWFSQYFDQFITSNAIRVVNASATVTRLSMHMPARTSPTNYNPYLYGLGLHEESLFSFTELVRNLNDFVKISFPRSQPLRAYTQFGTAEIVRHLIFDTVLPTWHNGTIPSRANLIANDNALVLQAPATRADFATQIQFLAARPTPATTNTPASYPVISGVNPDANTDTLLQLVTDVPRAATDPSLVRSFDLRSHYLPRCSIFDPSAQSTAHLASVITSGKIIEINDLSATGIPHVSAARPLGSTNSEYILGAIPIAHVQTGVTHTPYTVRRKNFRLDYRTPQITIRSQPILLMLPTFLEGLIRPTHTLNAPAPLESIFPGVGFLSGISDAHDGINVFAHALGSPSPTFPEQFFQMWSSYRYYDEESRSWYMLPSLRHIYGTRARTFISEHPALRIH